MEPCIITPTSQNNFQDIVTPLYYPSKNEEESYWLKKIIGLTNKHIPNSNATDWSIWDPVKQKASEYIPSLFDNERLEREKKQFVLDYSEVVKSAAEEFNIAAILLAAVAYMEYGGDPMVQDNITYNARKILEDPIVIPRPLQPPIIKPPMKADKPANKTSFGNLSLQIARAAESLGYSLNKLTRAQEKRIIKALENPIQNIYISAKHLSDLKNVDFEGVNRRALSDCEKKIIASRYNVGPEISIRDIQKIWEKEKAYGNWFTQIIKKDFMFIFK